MYPAAYARSNQFAWMKLYSPAFLRTRDVAILKPSTATCWIVAVSPVTNDHTTGSNDTFFPYSASTGGVSSSGSTEKETSLTRRGARRFFPSSAIARWSSAILAVSFGHEAEQCVKMKSHTQVVPESDAPPNGAPAWPETSNVGRGPS